MSEILTCLRIDRTNEKTVVTVTESPDPDDFAEIVDKVYELARTGSTNVRFDVGEVEYIPSTSLGALIALDRRIEDLGGQLVLARPSPSLCELLDITGLDSVLTVERA